MKIRQSSLDAAAGPFSHAAAIFVVFMMIYTTAAVVLRYSLNWTFVGEVDLMVLAFGFSLFLALPAVTLEGNHVDVDLIDHLIGPRAVRVLRWVGLAFTTVFLMLAFAYSVEPALDKLAFGETSMSINLNRFWYRVSALFGLGCAALACLFVAVSWLQNGQPRPDSTDSV